MFQDVLIIFFKQVKFLCFLFDVVDFDVVSFVDFNCFCFMDINVEVSLFGCCFQVGSFKLRGMKIIRKSVDVIGKVMQDFKFLDVSVCSMLVEFLQIVLLVYYKKKCYWK